ncbi:Maturase [Actinidia chinensis var. chinensis]|uniref:Maturase n=1 Tax=Actinidia chinensis var. chinensis TaxID=1590841 RepID=A0A2R6P5X3_ACTCC|nr:Maturase [Actinidia chinensis var. chinensis]
MRPHAPPPSRRVRSTRQPRKTTRDPHNPRANAPRVIPTHPRATDVTAMLAPLATMAQLEVSQPISIILDDSNYRLWSSAMQRFLRARKFWKYITGDAQPPHFSETDDDDDALHIQYQSQLEDWDSVNSKIITWFSNTSVSSIHSLFTTFETAKEVWDYLAERYFSVDGANEYQLGLELHHLRFDSTFTGFFSSCHPLPTIGQTLAELKSEETRKKTMVYQHSHPVLVTPVWAPLQPPSQSVRVPSSKNIPSGSQKKYCSFCRRDTHSYEDCRFRSKSKRKGPQPLDCCCH